MKITKQRNNPAAYCVAVGGVEFVAVFETLHNSTNGQPPPLGISGNINPKPFPSGGAFFMLL